MTSLFLCLLNMSITAGWIVLAVILLRFCLKKSPRWITCALWGIVALRLVLPFNIESPVSLIPVAETVATSEVGDVITITVDSGLPAIDEPLNQWLAPLKDTISDTPNASKPQADTPSDSGGTVENDGDVTAPPSDDGSASVDTAPTSKSRAETILDISAIVWLVGVAVLLLYEVASAFIVRRRVWDAVLLYDNVWESDRVETPFIFGTFRPRIYLPYRLEEASRGLVVEHERAHLRRLDNWAKPLAFTLLAVYWFNPFLWIAYFLLCRDIEVACDERVAKKLSDDDRRRYAAALLKCGTERRSLVGCPLAFGEIGVRQRIFSIIGYKKPMIWVVVISLILCAVAAVCLLTVPQTAVAQGLLDDVQNATTSTTTPTTTVSSTETTTTAATEQTTVPPTTVSTHTSTTGDAHTHVYGEWRIILAPTCEATGSKERVCSCGQIEQQVIIAVGHTYIRNVCVSCGDANGTDFIPDYGVGQANTIGNEIGSYQLARQGDWLYFVDMKTEEFRGILKCRTDGTELKKVHSIGKGYISSINVVGNWLYFAVENDANEDCYLGKVRTDGSGFEYVLQSVEVKELLIVDDVLYFTTIRSPYTDYGKDVAPLYMMPLSGGMTRQLHDGYVCNLASDGTYLYFEHHSQSDEDSLYRINLSTYVLTKVVADYNGCGSFVLNDNRIYYLVSAHEPYESILTYYLKCVLLDEWKIKTYDTILCSDTSSFAVIGNCVYYVGSVGTDGMDDFRAGIVELYSREMTYDVVYETYNDCNIIGLGDCLIWHDFYNPIRIYDYDSSRWIEVY